MLYPISSTDENLSFYRLSLGEDEKTYELIAVFQENLDDGYSVTIPELRHFPTIQSDTFEEAVSLVKNAIHTYLRDFPEQLNSIYETPEYQRKFAIPIKILLKI